MCVQVSKSTSVCLRTSNSSVLTFSPITAPNTLEWMHCGKWYLWNSLMSFNFVGFRICETFSKHSRYYISRQVQKKEKKGKKSPSPVALKWQRPWQPCWCLQQKKRFNITILLNWDTNMVAMASSANVLYNITWSPKAFGHLDKESMGFEYKNAIKGTSTLTTARWADLFSWLSFMRFIQEWVTPSPPSPRSHCVLRSFSQIIK